MASYSTPKEHLDESIKLAENLIDRCKVESHVKGTAKLARKIQSELKFLRKLSKKDDKNIEMHLKSTNLIHLQAVVNTMETLPNVTHIMKSFRVYNNSVVQVDVVCNNGYTWTKVVARKPKALHLIWAGGGQFGDRSIEEQAKQYMQCAKDNPKHFTTPQVVFIFVQGITAPLKQDIEKVGVIVQGHIEEMDSNLERQMQELKESYEEEEINKIEKDDRDLFGKSTNCDESPLNSYNSSDSEEELLTATELMSKKNNLEKIYSKDRNNDADFDLCQLSMLDSDNLGNASVNTTCFKTDLDNKMCVNDVEISGSAALKVGYSNDAISVSKTGSCDLSFNSIESFQADCYSLHQQNSSPSNISKSCYTVNNQKSKVSSGLLNETEKNNDMGNTGLFSDVHTSKVLWSDSFNNMSAGSLGGEVIDSRGKSQQTLSAYLSKGSGEKGIYQNEGSLPDSEYVNRDAKKPMLSSVENCRCNKCVLTKCKSECGGNFNCINYDSKSLLTCKTRGVPTDESYQKSSGQCNLITEAQTLVLNKQPVINKLNLDITTLISYVSNVCHGFCNLKFQEPILSQQAAEERQEKLLPKLKELFEGKQLFICETALNDFQTILMTVGGPAEKQRAEEFLKCIKVIPDCSSDRISHMECSAKIKERAKIIFGTGDSLQAMTVTANVGFVRAAEQKGIDLAVYVHPSRALTEQKEAKAQLL